jgi:hypothetical protein
MDLQNRSVGAVAVMDDWVPIVHMRTRLKRSDKKIKRGWIGCRKHYELKLLTTDKQRQT